MASATIAVPVLKMRTIFTVDRARPWGVVEHILLEALARRSWTVSQLAQTANLSKRVVVESIVRMMRSGWVELVEGSQGVTFRATSAGRTTAGDTELPTVPERKRKSIQFVVDLVSGEIFRNREWYVRLEKEVRARDDAASIIWLKPSSLKPAINPHRLARYLLDEEDTLIDAETAGAVRRIGIVSMVDGAIFGLPDGHDLAILRAAITQSAQGSPAALNIAGAETGVPGQQIQEVLLPPETPIHFTNTDLVIDGPAHQDILERVFGEARTTIIIHSTFISAERVIALWPMFEEALKRGVRIHVFWGEADDKEGVIGSAKAIATLRELSDVSKWGDFIRFHPFSTGSHAKVLVADDAHGIFAAVVGSCNWLTSSFTSFDVSVVIRDKAMIFDLVDLLCKLTYLHDGIWTQLATELVRIAQRVEKQSDGKAPNANGALVMGARHHAYVLRARDEAKKRIVVASHRLGAVSGPGVVVPLAEAATANNVTADVLYGRRTQPVRYGDEAAIQIDGHSGGVAVRMIESPRLHAKILAWDDDYVVISSLNWLSGDPVDLDSSKEVGVFIQHEGAAKEIFDALSRHDAL
jgi:cardiolipin synthase A/B